MNRFWRSRTSTLKSPTASSYASSAIQDAASRRCCPCSQACRRQLREKFSSTASPFQGQGPTGRSCFKATLCSPGRPPLRTSCSRSARRTRASPKSRRRCARWSCLPRWAWKTQRTAIPSSSRAACVSGWQLHARWASMRPRCCSTSPSGRSTRSSAANCKSFCCACGTRAKAAARRRSS